MLYTSMHHIRKGQECWSAILLFLSLTSEEYEDYHDDNYQNNSNGYTDPSSYCGGVVFSLFLTVAVC